MAVGRYLGNDVAMPDDVRKEWEDWLMSPVGTDLGHYNAYKDNHGKWKCDVYCPPHILAKIPNLPAEEG